MKFPASRLSTLDLILSVIGSPSRPADFGIVFHLKKTPTLEALRAGAKSARNRYPATGSVIEGKQWTPIAVPGDGVTAVPYSTDAVERFFARPFDPHKQAPIQQLIVNPMPGGLMKLVTRVHHAAGDGFSAAMWLRHQFRIANNLDCPSIEPAPFEPVRLRHHRSPERKNPFTDAGRAQCLCDANAPATGLRRWLTIELPGAFDGAALATAAIETLMDWNRTRGDAARQIGLWLPVNVRHGGDSHFGNGTSSVRIHPHFGADDSCATRCSEVRRQIRWRLKRGEWAVPRNPLIARLPLWISAPVLKLYLNRPWADVGTIPFSHAGDWTGQQDGTFKHVEKIECIGQLHKRHALAMNAVTHSGRTWLTFTFDPGQLTSDSIAQIANLYRRHLALAERKFA